MQVGAHGSLSCRCSVVGGSHNIIRIEVLACFYLYCILQPTLGIGRKCVVQRDAAFGTIVVYHINTISSYSCHNTWFRREFSTQLSA